MADYQRQFDEQVAAANSRVANHTTDLAGIIPGLHPSQMRRLFANISKLLGLVDRKEILHPEFLAATPRNVPEHAVELIASVSPSFDSGAQHFVQNVLPFLVDVEKRLTEAAGIAAFNTQEIKNQQIKALNRLLVDAEDSADHARTAMEKSAEASTIASENLVQLEEILIPTCTDYDLRAHLRRPMVMMRQG